QRPSALRREFLTLSERFGSFIFSLSRLRRPEDPRDVARMREKTMGLPEHFRVKEVAAVPVAVELAGGLKSLIERATSLEREATLALARSDIRLLQEASHWGLTPELGRAAKRRGLERIVRCASRRHQRAACRSHD